MAVSDIEGVMITPLKVISVEKGEVLHGIKRSEDSFSGFGEAYFSRIQCDQIKGWKKHTKMTMNIVVPIGAIQFVIFDDRSTSATYGKFFSITIDRENYCRLTVPQGVWMAFKGKSSGINMLMNFASIEHSPQEAKSLPLEALSFDWSEYE
ncbi:dTDP-4-dehydrorhamnose 3,5-epimerase family protein [Vibrio alginolyticus]|uniref:dTDP-4-dehydrorhamnose 3,5-epimerase family protein n=1 Tax=Vibrio harveyi group TaxID=717610 RepID=UPI0005395826|nr:MULTISPECIES: dTDP-4-dehydrorhamnose 3,5-epimerase family protein [Vibrio harveyi group]AIV04323.1 dTDP-4-dehydrorhamnose 3,5-epimerase [Vibrio harveyi]EKO3823525.1 dTDP-4-dehydrorhamnose 3,5-epimerase family protein [Vibrio harveyi]MDN8584569.1 dTDP-4-dehydrorhamnose 3,5-epimerase family protein [Vibrio alginolyticus]